MLDGEEFMARTARLLEGLIQTKLKLARQHCFTTPAGASGFLERTQQRVLMLARIAGHLRHFGLRDFVCKDSTNPFATSMHFQHDPRGRRPIHGKKSFQHLDHELHRRVVVVEQYHAVQRRLSRLRRCFLYDDAGIGAIGLPGLLQQITAPSHFRRKLPHGYRESLIHWGVTDASAQLTASAVRRAAQTLSVAMSDVREPKRTLSKQMLEERERRARIMSHSEGSRREHATVSAASGTDQSMSMREIVRWLTEHGAKLLVIILIIGLGLDSALILTRLLATNQTPTAAPTNALPFGPRSRNPQLVLASIANAHLFGAAPVSGNGLTAPPTTMPLILTGVIADNDHPNRGQAIIGANAADAKLYSVGAAISGGAHLHAVYSDRVLLERNGTLETLMLPRTPLARGSCRASRGVHRRRAPRRR